MNSTRLALAIIVALGLAACATPQVTTRFQALSLAQVQADNPHQGSSTGRLGIAFGGGGVRGFFHLGVLRALDESGIHADLVTGTSAGSIAAVMYASGKPYAAIEQTVNDVTEWEMADFTLSNRGVLKGQALANWVNQFVGADDIAALPVRLGVTVTDLTNNRAELVVKGNPGIVVQASSSVPGAFVPVDANGNEYVDGGVLSLVPVRFARAMGADVVVGVDIYCGELPAAEKGALSTAIAVFRLQSCTISAPEVAEADILIRPSVEPQSNFSFGSRKGAMEMGYKATLAIMPALREKLAKREATR